MHIPLPTLLLPLLTTTTTTSATTSRALPHYPNTCTFTLFHKQLHPSPTLRENYIQINTLIDHANALAISVAHLRHRTAFHSYSRISATQVFAIEGLLDGNNLTVRGEDGGDEVRFEYDGVVWGSGEKLRDEAHGWCEVGVWDGDLEDGSRVSFVDLICFVERGLTAW